MPARTKGACIGCGRHPRPPRTAWDAHPATGEPCCPLCVDTTRGHGVGIGYVAELDKPMEPIDIFERTDEEWEADHELAFIERHTRPDGGMR